MRIFIFLFAFISIQGVAQDPIPPADLFGEDLKSWLYSNWYQPWTSFLDYSGAREEMYSYIDNEDGQVFCVYSGYHQEAAFTSFLDPINCEHSVPQSFFNELEPMKSDIHHLYPTHGNVNSARGNLPYLEISDSETETWYVGDESGVYDSFSIPTVSIDSYSELQTSIGFEPREDHKGDLARSIFYFYTMYPFQAGPLSNLADQDVLYEWHIEDPVDDSEYTRDEKIQEVQGNYNPYVRDPNLVGRAWGYITQSVEETETPTLVLFPNPSDDLINIKGFENQEVRVSIFTPEGQMILEENYTKGVLNISRLPEGLYFIIVQSNSFRVCQTFIRCH